MRVGGGLQAFEVFMIMIGILMVLTYIGSLRLAIKSLKQEKEIILSSKMLIPAGYLLTCLGIIFFMTFMEVFKIEVYVVIWIYLGIYAWLLFFKEEIRNFSLFHSLGLFVIIFILSLIDEEEVAMALAGIQLTTGYLGLHILSVVYQVESKKSKKQRLTMVTVILFIHFISLFVYVLLFLGSFIKNPM